MREFFGATWVTTVASQLSGVAGIVAVLAAILAIARRDAIAGRMSTSFAFSHVQSDQPLVRRTVLRPELFRFYPQSADPAGSISLPAYEAQVSVLLDDEERMAVEFFIACAPEDPPVIPGPANHKGRVIICERTKFQIRSKEANQVWLGAGAERQGDPGSSEGRSSTAYVSYRASRRRGRKANPDEGGNVASRVCARVLHQSENATGMGARAEKAGCNDARLSGRHCEEPQSSVERFGVVKLAGVAGRPSAPPSSVKDAAAGSGGENST